MLRDGTQTPIIEACCAIRLSVPRTYVVERFSDAAVRADLGRTLAVPTRIPRPSIDRRNLRVDVDHIKNGNSRVRQHTCSRHHVIGGTLARVADFWLSESGIITAQCTACVRVASVAGYTYRDTASVIFVQSHKIIDAVAYRNLAGGDFRVVLPYLARHR